MKELTARNNSIRLEYKKGLGGKIGRQQGISRQRVGQIIHSKRTGKPSGGRRGQLRREVMVIIRWLISRCNKWR